MVDYHSILHLREQRAARARRRLAMVAQNLRLQHENYRELKTQRDAFLEEIQALEIKLMNALLERPVTINDVLNVDEIMRVATHRAQSLAEKLNEANNTVEEATIQHKEQRDIMRLYEGKRRKSQEVLSYLIAAERKSRLRQGEESMEDYVGFNVAQGALHE